jgi:cobalt-zinc-cadmium efflux system outer membrane protein
MPSRPLFAFTLSLVMAGCTGSQKRYDDVADTIRNRTGHEVPLPSHQLSQADVERHIAALLARPLTASSAAQIALLNNPKVRATLEELNLSQADLLEAALPTNPTLAASARWPSGGGSANTEFGLAGDVLNWLLLPLRQRMALREYEAAKRRVTHELLDTIFETKEAFYELQAQQQVLGTLEQSLEVSKLTSDVARRLREAGNITALELLQQQTSSKQAAVEQTRARGELASAREALNRHMGLTTAQGSRWRFAATLPSIPGSEPPLARLESIAVGNRQDLAAQREIVAALQHGYSLTSKTRLFPALNVGVETEREPDGVQLTGPTLDVELPIFNLGQARVQKSKAQLAQAQANLAATELEVRSDVRRALSQVQSARQLHHQISSELLPQRRQILGETLLQYNAMQVSNFELLQARADQVEVERDQIEALRDFWIARARLERAAGGSLTAAGRSSGKAAPSSATSRHAH